MKMKMREEEEGRKVILIRNSSIGKATLNNLCNKKYNIRLVKQLSCSFTIYISSKNFSLNVQDILPHSVECRELSQVEYFL